MPISPTQVRDLVEKVVAGRGFDLEEVEVRNRDGQDEVSVVVDRDGGSDLDVLAGLSNEISDALDAAPELADLAYVLEVTSRGVDRPLTHPRHWRRNVGRRVAIDVAPDVTDDEPGADATGRTVTGRIGRLLDDPATRVEVVVNHRGRIAVETIDLDAVTKAVVQVDFSQPSTRELELCGLDADEIEQRRSVRQQDK
ncbi:ribosome maturation factor RimP [Gordonia sp. zg691]|uniref:Ribosome maturation factor RimP n=1 Tax=Gordonia jinghuaiqii TaxID=2758710 RepID=A0A7D7QJU9_9ACTN|nr:ribosome maturation factor RimP [Gordonia jinghuaiqii]MBD0861301.1 ribosome maturation factor RimP [Gordonia jinghuaiqii]MCR5976208.1 ribosome maturation factor RimP [Gordonia jinghuaiqii]QMT03444.1 ribosome maturation factor RimP [Gordonia jinghuaiqii]